MFTEHDIRQRATTNSYMRGETYYHNGAVGLTTRDDSTIRASVEGSQSPQYTVTITLDQNTIASAHCTCPYDGVGDCKHIVAVLLTHLRHGQPPTPEISLDDLTADQLRQVVRALLDRDPELHDWLRVTLPAIAGETETRKSRVTVDTVAYRRQIINAVGQINYGSHWDSIWAVVSGLETAHAQAQAYLTRGDFRNALALMRILGEEVAPDYGNLEEECQLADFLDGWSDDLAEAILGADLPEAERQTLRQQMEEWDAELSDYGLDETMQKPLAACTDDDADLTEARLNVIAYQGDDERYLQVCLQQGEHARYALRLIALGRINEAVAHVKANSLRVYDYTNEYLQVGQSLEQAGHMQAAYEVGMDGIFSEARGIPLAEWVAEVAESLGQLESAREAWHIIYEIEPSITAYRQLKRLSGKQWPTLQPRLREQAHEKGTISTRIQIAIEDGAIEQAIQLWDQMDIWRRDYGLRDQLVEAAAEGWPDWAIEQALAEAEGLIQRGSKYYPHAVRWLSKIKRIYEDQDRQSEWLACITRIKSTHGHKYSLMDRIEKI